MHTHTLTHFHKMSLIYLILFMASMLSGISVINCIISCGRRCCRIFLCTFPAWSPGERTAGRGLRTFSGEDGTSCWQCWLGDVQLLACRWRFGWRWTLLTRLCDESTMAWNRFFVTWKCLVLGGVGYLERDKRLTFIVHFVRSHHRC